MSYINFREVNKIWYQGKSIKKMIYQTRQFWTAQGNQSGTSEGSGDSGGSGSGSGSDDEERES